MLAPAEIAAPKHTDVALSVRCADGQRHVFVLETPHPYRVTIVGGTSARLLLKGIPNGSYAIVVDHVRRGKLIVGVAPGP